LKTVFIEHFHVENELFEKYDISRKEEHKQAHDEIIKSISEIENYNLLPIIYALLLCDIIISYFLKHFQEYDKKFILELNQKMSL
jgi:hemerythrin